LSQPNYTNLNASRQIGLSLALSALYLLAFYYVFGFFDDNHDISYRTSLMRGDFTIVPISNFYIYFIDYSASLSLLFNKFPLIPWLGILLFLLHSFVVYVSFRLIMRLLNVLKWPPLLQAVSSFAVVFIIIGESSIYFTFARCCMQAAACTVIWWLLDPPVLAHKIRFVLRVLFSAIIIGFAALTVNEVVIIALITVFILLLVSKPNLQALWPLIGICLLIYAAVYTNIYLVSNPYKTEFLQKEKFIFAYHDAGYRVSPSDFSAADKIKAEAVANWFFADKKQITIPFLQKLTSDRYSAFLFKPGLNTRFKELWLELKYAALKRTLGLTVFTALIIIILIGIFRGKDSRRKALLPLISYAAFIAFIVALSIIIKYDYKVVVSAFVISALVLIFHLTNLIEGQAFSRRGLWWFSFCLLCLISYGSWWNVKYLGMMSALEKHQLEVVNSSRYELNAMYPGKIIVPDLDACAQLSLNAVLKTEPFMTDTVLGYDCGYSTFYPQFDSFISTRCGGNDFESFINYLWNRKTDVVIIATPERISLWSRFMEILYHKKIAFKMIPGPDSFKELRNCGWKKDFGCYQIQSLQDL
jgi:hypothetical protein